MRGIAILAIIALSWQSCQAMPVMVFTDSFDISPPTSSSLDINFQVGSPRQSGSLAPVTYVDNAGTGGNDYHTQVNTSLTPQQLLLFGDSSLSQPLASPTTNFSGGPPSAILGKRITVSFNVGNSGAAIPNAYIQAGFTIGASTTLVAEGSAVPHFGLRFVEDTFNSPAAQFMQAFDGSTLVGNLLPHGRGNSRIDLQLDIDDPADGNPWDGVGSTKIDVLVNAVPVFSYTKGGGGYTSNFLTMSASANFVGLAPQAHNFNNLVVFAAAVPEASSFACGAAISVLTGLTWIRTRRRS